MAGNNHNSNFKFSCITQNVRGSCKLGKMEELCTKFQEKQLLFATIQETWRFKNDTLDLLNCKIIHAGIEPPSNPATRSRGRPGKQGVAIILNNFATKAWNNSNNFTYCYSGRIVAVRLVFPARNSQLKPLCFYIVSAYAPTSDSSNATQTTYLDNLKDCLSKRQKDDILILGTDANASLGTRSGAHNATPQNICSIGNFGIANRNAAGARLLTFLQQENLVAMSTYFQKPVIKYSTWVHPRHKTHYQIDHIITNKEAFKYFKDVTTTKHLADSDHYPVLAKLEITHRHRKRPACPDQSKELKKLDFEKLKDSNTASSFCQDILSRFNSSTESDPYKRLSSIIPLALHNTLPRKRRIDNDWFSLAKLSIAPIILQRNKLCKLLKQSNSTAHRIQLKYARQRISSQVKAAKNSWVQNLSSSINDSSSRGTRQRAWNAFKSLKKGHSNIRSCKITNLRKKDKSLCKTPRENAEAFKDHFVSIFQSHLPFDPAVLNDIPDIPPFNAAATIPTLDETTEAIKNLNNTAAGPSQIPSTVWKCLADNPATLQITHESIINFWATEISPTEWNTGLLKILAKKGDLHNPNNYRGITLLESSYKILANIIRARLTPIAEAIDQESQCGFRPGRSTIDAIFSLKIALKKRKEHGLDTYVLFLDLVKAFDKVPRDMLWLVLQKFGVPPKLINLLKALHTDVKVNFECNGVEESFLSAVGVKQGDILGPILFNFYIAAILISWRATTCIVPCSFQTSRDFQLNGRNHLSNGEILLFRDSAYADDTAVAFTNRIETETGTNEIIQHFKKFGMTVHTGDANNPSKSEIVKFAAQPDAYSSSQDKVSCPNNTFIPFATKFPYLGSTIPQDLADRSDIQIRIEKAGKAYNGLRKAIFNNSLINLHSKASIYKAIIIPILIYGSENWCLSTADERLLRNFHHSCIRRICKMNRFQLHARHITMIDLRNRSKIPTMLTLLTRHKLRYAGHVARMGWHRTQRKLLSAWVRNNRPSGSPGLTFARSIKRALERANISIGNWHNLAQDRYAWRHAVYNATC